MKNSICFLGTGKINRKHIKTVRGLFPKMRIGIASRDAERALAFKKEFGLQASFAGYSSAIDSDFSTIAIGVPPIYHSSLILASLANGKHVFVEKPVVGSMAELKGIWPEIKRSRTTVMVGENHWFDPFHRKIKRCIADDRLGRPLLLELVRMGSQKAEGWRGDSEQMPLGPLHEGGVHWIRRLLDLASVHEDSPRGSVLSVNACRLPTPEETMIVTARHRSGLISRLFHSWSIPKRSGFLDLSKMIFENGAVYFNSMGIIGIVFGGKNRFIFPSLSDNGGFRGMWSHFISCIESGRKPDLAMEEIFDDFAYMEAAYRSAASKKDETPERIPEI